MNHRAETTRYTVRLHRMLGIARPRRRMARPRHPVQIEREYSRQLLQVVELARQAFQPVMDELAALLHRASLTRRVDHDLDRYDEGESIRVQELIAMAKARLNLNTSGLADLAASIANRVSVFQRDQFSRQVQSQLGIDLLLPDSGVRATIEPFVTMNVSLIKSIPERLYGDLESTLLNGVQKGLLLPDLADQIAKKFDIAGGRALNIARDQAGTLLGQINEVRQTSVGVEEYIWRTMQDERVRGDPDGKYPDADPSHFEREGETFRWDDPPEGGHPGEDQLCLPGDAQVSLYAPALKSYRRFYRGELTQIVADSCESIRCTPNHPVLTARGWLAAHLVQVGDYLIDASAKRDSFAIQNPQGGDATAEQVFGAVAKLGIAHRTVTPSAMGFHGDGSNQQIDVVEIDWCLFFESIAKAAELGRENELAFAARATLALGHSAADIVWSAPAAYRRMGSMGPSDSLCPRRSSHADDKRFAAIAWLDTVREQDAANGSPFAFHFASDRQLAHAVSIQTNDCRFRQVQSVVSWPWEGLVYNFETVTGWYASHGLVCHNCRCFAEPVLDGLSEDELADEEIAVDEAA